MREDVLDLSDSRAIPLIARDPSNAGRAGTAMGEPVCGGDLFSTFPGLVGTVDHFVPAPEPIPVSTRNLWRS